LDSAKAIPHDSGQLLYQKEHFELANSCVITIDADASILFFSKYDKVKKLDPNNACIFSEKLHILLLYILV
jgi:hypothetical protein